MKALQVSKEGENYKLNVIDTTTPKFKDGQVLVQIKASFINPSDVMNTKGGFPHTTFPRIPGRDFSGVVVGPEDSKIYKKEVYGTSGNDLSVTIDGAHAEYCVIRESALAIKPKNLSHIQAAICGTSWTTAALTVQKANVSKDDTVLILGSTGNVGNAALQLSRQIGATVLTGARNDEASINLKKDSKLETAKKITKDGKGPTVIIETIGDTALLAASIDALADGGRLSYISVGRSPDPFMKVDMKSIYRRELSILGNNSISKTAEVMAELMVGFVPGFEDGTLKAPEESEYTKWKIEDGVKAYESKGKNVIVFD